MKQLRLEWEYLQDFLDVEKNDRKHFVRRDEIKLLKVCGKIFWLIRMKKHSKQTALFGIGCNSVMLRCPGENKVVYVFFFHHRGSLLFCLESTFSQFPVQERPILREISIARGCLTLIDKTDAYSGLKGRRFVTYFISKRLISMHWV